MSEKSADKKVRRRTILRSGALLGSGVAVGGLVGGQAVASPGMRGRGRGGVGPCTCEENCTDGYVCGKVEGQPESGETYTFSSDGEEYIVTIDDVETKEGGEIVGFTFSTTDDIEKVCVKGGTDTVTYTGDDLDGWLYAPENPGGQQAEISNFSFCGRDVAYYQIDLVRGEPICDIGGDDGTTYGPDRLLQVLAVSEEGEVTQFNENDSSVVRSCINEFHADLSFDAETQEASVSFDVADQECTLSLVGYRLAGGCTRYSECRDEPQTLLACQVASYDGGETDQTLTIDLDDGDCPACTD